MCHNFQYSLVTGLPPVPAQILTDESPLRLNLSEVKSARGRSPNLHPHPTSDNEHHQTLALPRDNVRGNLISR
jgi:hypothetical protein